MDNRTFINDLLSRVNKENLLYSIEESLLRRDEINLEDGIIIVPQDENTVIIQNPTGEEYAKAVLTTDRSNVNLEYSDEKEFKKAELELKLYKTLIPTQLFYSSSFHNLRGMIKSEDNCDALLNSLKFYESLCSNLFQKVEIIAQLLGKKYNINSLGDCIEVVDSIIATIRESYPEGPDTTPTEESDDLSNIRDHTSRIVGEMLPDLVEKVRKELGI